jgi:DNA polymerase-1
VIDIMRNAAKLDVPLEVNVSWGASWASAKG